MQLVVRSIALLAALSGLSLAQSSNDATFNNGGDVTFLYSSPSSGFSSLAVPPDVTGDLYWRAHSGAEFMNNVEPGLGSTMEIDGYYETIWDTDWTTSPHFYTRVHGPALPDGGGLGGLEPSFFQLGLGGGAYPETMVVLGPTGFGSPCTISPTLCSPPGSTCPPPGFATGYLVDIQFGSTPGSGVVVHADGTPASNYALTYFLPGGMTTLGGACGQGDYVLQSVHSTDESQADVTGYAINPDAGFQVAGGGPVMDAVTSMAEQHETWRGNVFQLIANTGLGAGVEHGVNGGGAMNGRRLAVGSGVATLGGELRDFAAVGSANVGVGALSFTPITNPGLAVLGGNLLIAPDALVGATSGIWQAPVSGATFVFTPEGRALFPQIPVPLDATGATVYAQAARINLSPTLSVDATNASKLELIGDGGFTLVPASEAIYTPAISPGYYPRLFVPLGYTELISGASSAKLQPPAAEHPYSYGPGAHYVIFETGGVFKISVLRPGVFHKAVTQSDPPFYQITTTIFVDVEPEDKTVPGKTGCTENFTVSSADLVLSDKIGTHAQRWDYYENDLGETMVEVTDVADAVAKVAAHVQAHGKLDRLTIANHASPGNISLGSGPGTDAAKEIGKTVSGAPVGAYQAFVDGLQGKFNANAELCLIGSNVGDLTDGQVLVNGLAADLGIKVRAKKGAVTYPRKWWQLHERYASSSGERGWAESP